jgi:hypothetical protein
MQDRPWLSGPAELLRHGLGHLSEKSDVNRRLAFLSIDNAVEMMLRTYLGLPRRETGIHVSRAELKEMGESFPRLLERIEELAPDRLDGVDPTAVDHFHKLRNKLYHEGNGLTPERANWPHTPRSRRSCSKICLG